MDQRGAKSKINKDHWFLRGSMSEREINRERERVKISSS